MDEHELAQLPPGTVIETPGGLTSAVLVANAFRNGRPGWRIKGIDGPVPTHLLSTYGRGWRVREGG